MVDVVRDHSELLLFVDDFRFSESSHERWCFENVSPLRQECRRCWNQCSHPPSQGWTYPHHHDFWDNHLLALCAIFPQQVASFYRDLSGRVFLPLCRLPRSIGRTEIFLQLANNLLGNGFPRSIFNGFRGLGWSVSPSDCWTNFPTGQFSTVEPWSFPFVQLRSCFKEIFGGGRRDKCCLSHNTSPFFNLSPLTMQWAAMQVFPEGWLHWIWFDRISVLLWFQDQCQSRIPCPDAFSTIFAHIGHDAAQNNQHFLDLGDFHLLDQQARRTQIVCRLILDLQESVHCWQLNEDWNCFPHRKCKETFQVQSTRCPLAQDQ